ncbi:VTT domain-containing protein [Kitasatospora sp. RB6PN24]|uniref:DedA family protein n=1 Tax=Kitasatospora humi TaxID=2893891 RepID=UPI001E63F012|nr:DedA family protein [Kitasatospora humi]MCC9306585.1 VTT domain-containing protein [Kitasatospora humi]
MNLTGLVAAAGMWAYALIFLLTAGETSAFVGLVLPSETVVLFAAALSSRGVLNPFLLCLAVVAGGIVGDSTGYWLGRLFGKRIDAPSRRRRIRPGGRIDRAAGYLRRRGGPAVFTARFIGFVRSFVPFTAGAARMPYRSFLGYSAAASFTWGPLNVAAGYFLGASAAGLLRTVGLAGLIAVGAAVLLLAGVLAWRQRRRRTAAASEPTGPAPPTAPPDAPDDRAEQAAAPGEGPTGRSERVLTPRGGPAGRSRNAPAPTGPSGQPTAPAEPQPPRDPHDAPAPAHPLAGHGPTHRRT